MKMKIQNRSVLDNLIVGRIDPHIYAFKTNTIPNYLKVGDTYRPVSVRIKEWLKHFPDLQHDKEWIWTAKTQDGKYFRDFAVHYYLETIKGFHRLSEIRLRIAELGAGPCQAAVIDGSK